MIINELKLFTSDLSAQTDFYAKTLGLKITNKTDEAISFKIGRSLLTFEYRENTTPYHFAINIATNKEKEALNWLKERVEILKDRENEIQYFDFWNAYAVYFYDADNNIVEFIARENKPIITNKNFDQNALLEISEIGLVTDNIEKEFDLLNQKAGLNIYSGNLDSFCAIGNDTGMFICIDKNKKEYWYPTLDQPFSSDFSLIMKEKEKEFTIEFQNNQLNVTSYPF